VCSSDLLDSRRPLHFNENVGESKTPFIELNFARVVIHDSGVKASIDLATPRTHDKNIIGQANLASRKTKTLKLDHRVGQLPSKLLRMNRKVLKIKLLSLTP